MRPFLLAAALAAAFVNPADAFDIPAVYGSVDTCPIRDDSGAMSSDGNFIAPENFLVVRPTSFSGLDWGCDIASLSDAGEAQLACSGEGDEWPATATLSLSANDTLTVTMDGATYTLNRCD